VPITRGTNNAASDSNAATAKKNNPDPPPAAEPAPEPDWAPLAGAGVTGERIADRATLPTRLGEPEKPEVRLDVGAKPKLALAAVFSAVNETGDAGS
jgi:hypothetical protein